MDSAEVLFVLNVISFVIYAPYTKVEESFNLQACHDILKLGLSNTSRLAWDHHQFPGAVPRTFIGALILSALSYPVIWISNIFGISLTGLHEQMVVRGILGLVNAAAMIYLKRTISRVHGKTVSLFYLAMQGTQFHVMYYASRTLPNFFAFPITTMATAALITRRPHRTISLLTIATVIFRAEIVLFLGPIVLYQFACRNISLIRTVKYGVVSVALAGLTSFLVDSIIWGYPVVPEVVGVLFNVHQGNSSNWGTSPWYTYALDILKLLLNPLALPLIGYAAFYSRAVPSMLVPNIAFCVAYSFLPHKEWRFIVYVIPGLTFIAALGAARIYQQRSKNIFYRLLAIAILASIPCTGLLSHTMGMISMMSYPGGEMMARIPSTTQPIYLDVLTCMTGSTRFLQQTGNYERTEDDQLLNSSDFWNRLKYASVSDPAVVRTSDDRWKIIGQVHGFSGINLRQMRIKKDIKLYLMENTQLDD